MKHAMKAAVVCAGAGGLCLHLYLSRYEQEVRGGDMVPVLSVVRDAAPGDLIADHDLRQRLIPERYVDERHVAAADRARIEGNRLQVAVAAGDALMWTDIGMSERHKQLSDLVGVGRRAVRIDGRDVSFGGLLRPGDRVDVLITEKAGLVPSAPVASRTLLENVLVLAVGDRVSLDAEASARGAVTLSLLPGEATVLEASRRRGTLGLALRNPEDLSLTRRAGSL